MASLTGQSVASSYEQLLHVDRDGGGNGTTLVDIKDGDNGTTFALQLATDKINVNGSATFTGSVVMDSFLTLKTTDDQANSWVLYTHTDDSFQLNHNGAGNAEFNIDSAGNITSPANPAFQVQNSADHLNIAVGSTYIDKTFDTEIFDQGSNFASNVFTAPVTGKYLLISKLAFQSADATDAVLYNLLVTSNRSYNSIGGGGLDADTTIHLDITVVADMDANDTAKVQYRQIGGAAQADVVTSSFFAGYLLG